MAVSAKTVVVLGGGWGGLAAAHALRELLPVEHRIRLVERSGTFSLCTSYLWLMTGERRDPDQIRRELGRLSRPGIEWVHDEITRIDPATRSIETTSGRLDADYVVIALGAELAPDVIPGLAASAHNLYDIRDVARLHKVLSGFREGRLVILIARTPFRCPAAPYEARVFGPFLIFRTVEPVVTPKAFLYYAARALLVGQQLGIGDADINVRTVVLAARVERGYGPSLRSRSSNSR